MFSTANIAWFEGENESEGTVKAILSGLSE